MEEGTIGRKTPVHGVRIHPDHPTIVFLTVGTKNHEPWLSDPCVHNALLQVWQKASAWNVGRYVLMPDHLHLTCGQVKLEFSLDQWVSHWKRQFSRLHLEKTGSWLRSHWDVRLRTPEHCAQKWRYAWENPVRAGLVKEASDWPYQGELNQLAWR